MKNAQDNKKVDKDKGSSAMAGVGKSVNMMPTKEKMNEQSDADPAIKKDTSSLLHKEKNNKKENEKD